MIKDLYSFILNVSCQNQCLKLLIPLTVSLNTAYRHTHTHTHTETDKSKGKQRQKKWLNQKIFKEANFVNKECKWVKSS